MAREPNPYCIPKKIFDAIENYICNGMYHTFVNNIPCNFNKDELIHLIVKEEHHDVARLNKQIYDTYYFSTAAIKFRCNKSVYQLVINTNFDFYAPKYAASLFQERLQDPDYHKYAEPYIEFIKKNEEIYHDCRNVLKVFRRLCETFTSAKELRFMWPPIVALLTATGHTDWARRLHSGTFPKETPRFDPEFRACLERSIVTVLSLQFAKGDPKNKIEPPIKLVRQ